MCTIRTLLVWHLSFNRVSLVQIPATELSEDRLLDIGSGEDYADGGILSLSHAVDIVGSVECDIIGFEEGVHLLRQLSSSLIAT